MTVLCLPSSSHWLRLRIANYYCFFAQHYFSHVQLGNERIANDDHPRQILQWSPEDGLQAKQRLNESGYLACTSGAKAYALCCDEFVIVSEIQLPRWTSLHARQRRCGNDYLLAVGLVDQRLGLLCEWEKLLRHLSASSDQECSA